ncbi:hypothetical protein TYRP_022860 [Tyrophagus putrescentiae]|nr:hypothetical protein TYRP_022860 [Tyrophagus putrescentiae]
MFVELKVVDHQLAVGLQLVLALKEFQHAGCRAVFEVNAPPFVGNKLADYLLSSVVEQASGTGVWFKNQAVLKTANQITDQGDHLVSGGNHVRTVEAEQLGIVVGIVILEDRRSVHHKDYVSRLEIAPEVCRNDALLTVAYKGLSLGKHVTSHAGHQVEKAAHQNGVNRVIVKKEQPTEGQFGGLCLLQHLIVKNPRKVDRRLFRVIELRNWIDICGERRLVENEKVRNRVAFKVEITRRQKKAQQLGNQVVDSRFFSGLQPFSFVRFVCGH